MRTIVVRYSLISVLIPQSLRKVLTHVGVDRKCVSVGKNETSFIVNYQVITSDIQFQVEILSLIPLPNNVPVIDQKAPTGTPSIRI